MSRTPVSELLDGFDEIHRENLDDSTHPAYYARADGYQVLNVRFFTLEAHHLAGINYPFLIMQGQPYRYDPVDQSCEPLEAGFEEMHAFLEEKMDFSQKILAGYIDQIESLEDSLYSRSIALTFMDHWFGIKKDISRMERIFARTLYVMGQFTRSASQRDSFPVQAFQDVLEHIDHAQRLCRQNLEKLDTLYHYYSSLKSDKMNSNMYLLTMLSGIFLPLNLLVGFFGMNTENLFFNKNPDGTMLVVYLLSSLFIVMLIGLPLVKKLEQIAVRRLLGRYSFYQKIRRQTRKWMEIDLNDPSDSR